MALLPELRHPGGLTRHAGPTPAPAGLLSGAGECCAAAGLFRGAQIAPVAPQCGAGPNATCDEQQLAAGSVILEAAVSTDVGPLPAQEFPHSCAMVPTPGCCGPSPRVCLQPSRCHQQSCRSWPCAGQGEPAQPHAQRVCDRCRVVSAWGLMFVRKRLGSVGPLPSIAPPERSPELRSHIGPAVPQTTA